MSKLTELRVEKYRYEIKMQYYKGEIDSHEAVLSVLEEQLRASNKSEQEIRWFAASWRRRSFYHEFDELKNTLNRIEREIESIQGFPANPSYCIEEGKECSIACDKISFGQVCYVLKCGHMFSEEIVTWWKTNQRATCPLCRGPIE